MHLLDVDGETTSRIQTSRTHSTFEMLCFLVLHKD